MQDVHGRVDEEGYGYVGVPQVSGRAYKTVAAPWSLGMALTRHRRLSFPLRYMRLSIQALHPQRTLICRLRRAELPCQHGLRATEVHSSCDGAQHLKVLQGACMRRMLRRCRSLSPFLKVSLTCPMMIASPT
jgi:hypothetical protein